ncbi:hypothetical protein L7F22_040698 [Adiantum nelumboides]|nr:hypothetical protein [Adiantum nelumboides]
MGEAYIDGGAQVCVITQSCVKRLGLITCGSPGFWIRIANHAKVKCLGMIKNLEVKVFNVKVIVNFHVMPAGLGAFPLILERPWLRAVGAVQDWGKGTIYVYGKKGEKRVFDMTTKQPMVLEDVSENDESETTSDDSFEDSKFSTPSSSSDEVSVRSLSGGVHVSCIQEAAVSAAPSETLPAEGGAHTDYGLITLVNQDAEPCALQVRNQAGNWIWAPPIPEAFVVNIGDMLKIFSNGLYQPTLHRVINNSPLYRVSVPFFLEPNFDAVIEPLEFCSDKTQANAGSAKPVIYGEHLVSKVTTNFYD